MDEEHAQLLLDVRDSVVDAMAAVVPEEDPGVPEAKRRKISSPSNSKSRASASSNRSASSSSSKKNPPADPTATCEICLEDFDEAARRPFKVAGCKKGRQFCETCTMAHLLRLDELDYRGNPQERRGEAER